MPYLGNDLETVAVFTTSAFTGDGSTTVFTMATSAPNNKSVIITIDGVTQHVGAYTTSGTTLTFDDAPANLVDIQVIHITNAVSTGVSTGLTEDFRGLHLRTHVDQDSETTKLWFKADEIVMSDGQVISDWDNITIDSATELQAGALANNLWYKVYARYNSTTDTKKGWVKLGTTYTEDIVQTSTANTEDLHRLTTLEKLAQSFSQVTTGQVPFIDVSLLKVASATGNIWFTIEGDSAGDPDGTPLATSDKLNAADFQTSAEFYRVPFRNPVTLTASTTYHLVMQSDYGLQAANHIGWNGHTTSQYAGGTAKSYNGSVWTNPTAGVSIEDFAFRIYTTENSDADDPVDPESGYVSAHIGWVRTNGSAAFEGFVARGRQVTLMWAASAEGLVVAAADSNQTFVALEDFIPPGLIEVQGGLSHVQTDSWVNFGGITDGFQAGQTGGAGGAVYTRTSETTTETSDAFSGLLTELQGGYHSGKTGANHAVFIWGYTW